MSANPITNTESAYVKEIKMFCKRELATLATTIKKVAIEDEISANEALDTIQGELYKISTNSATSELKRYANSYKVILFSIYRKDEKN